MDAFRFRLNCIDHYQATPTCLDPVLRRSTGSSQRGQTHQVPVIRAFGATETGQKVCAHIHGALPYLYLEYTGGLEEHVGVPFFGYNVGYKIFLKVYMLNPLNMTRLTDLLHQGAILNRVFQPYESHLQYILQWMCDYNLYGCDYIRCSKVLFRGPVPDSDEIDVSVHKWHDASIPDDFIVEKDQFPRQSHCTIEVDIAVQDILNRHELQYRPIHHDFLERSSQIPSNPDDKYVPSMAGLWRDETRRRRLQMGLDDPSSSPFPAEAMVSMSADPRSKDKSGWIHEEEYRDLISELIEAERHSKSDVKFDTFVKPIEGQEGIKTAVESIEDLFPSNLASQQLPDEDQKEQVTATDNEDSDLPLNVPVDEDHQQLEKDNVENAQSKTEVDTEEQQSLDLLSMYLFQGSGEGNISDEPTDEGLDPVNPSEDGLAGGLEYTSNARKRPFEGFDEDSRKRQRIVALTQGSSKRVAFQNTDGAIEDELLQLAQSSQASIKAQGLGRPNTLSFPVVKDHSAPETHRKPTMYFGYLPPTYEVVESTIVHAGLPPVIYQDAHYSEEKDVPDRAREYAGREFKLQGTTLPYLPSFDPVGNSAANIGEHPPVVLDRAKEESRYKSRAIRCSLRHWEIAKPPPSFQEVERWTRDEADRSEEAQSEEQNKPMQIPNPSWKREVPKHLSQIEGPTQKNKHGFKYSQNKNSTSVKHDTQYMSIMSLEVHVNSRKSLVPDPAKDEIQCIFYSVQGEENATTDHTRLGILCLSTENGIAQRIAKQVPIEMEYEEDELDLINRLVDIVRQFDPDILAGYEVHNSSWGFLIERARMKYEYNLCDEISRIKSQPQERFGKDTDRWSFTHTSTIRITGRHMINIWRAMRGELNLLQYTMENVVFHLLHKRIPHYQHADLTNWYTSSRPKDLTKVLEYFLTRVQLNLEILEANEIVPRTSEQARLLGVDFFAVISRGSQFKVESTMFRIAKPENFILVSPSRRQVGQQNALECLPLVMEPQSAFYTSPLLVLDFQSLYPSVMIAYNYCYSTCLGRIVSWRGRNKMGFMDFKREPQLLELVKDYINVAPNGMMYVKPEMRKSLLAKMLGEILETRVMIKSGMKQGKDDKSLQRLLNNRQLALKLLANVTYGYASASFSGRMPCSEIADSIVQTGRETLEKAIAIIHATEKWGAEVVYGDTDSLFVYLKGRTRDQAFTIGEEIAAAITAANPRPIRLKFEKVYHPCVLIAKKRYVGFKYEHRNQKEPDFDAKGIETVRRDGTPAEQKIEEKALKILFRTADLSQVKSYFQEQCSKIMQGRISIQDFLFAKEVKLGNYSDRGPPPPGALIATKRMLADPRTEPQYGERVPYVVVTGAPGARLIDRCVSPETLLQSEHLELDAEYYISKNLIPPLERIFNLVGANVRQWFDEMPKIQRIRNITFPLTIQPKGMRNALPNRGVVNKKRTLESYMKPSACVVCRAKLPPTPRTLPGVKNDAYALLPLCTQCLKRPARSLVTLKERIRRSETKAKDVDMVCRSCAGLAWCDEIRCESRDCPVFYTRIRERSKLSGLREGIGRVVEVIEEHEDQRGWGSMVGEGSGVRDLGW
ncbi:hypothetical protein GQ44DRAFT_818764 [Phaeosphaeriaceae sp. PMI808]|nr:hypothetical protein GQ44DRAFT_818764 [Phaeosphaeriaceae sp. PMI808]